MSKLLSIIGTSYLDSVQRFDWADCSLNSLQTSAPGREVYLSLEYPTEKKKLFPFRLKNKALANKAVDFCESRRVRWNWVRKRSSVKGLGEALERSMSEGSDFAFIHLDDNVYVKNLGVLLQHAEHALLNNEDLLLVKLTGYPMLTKVTDPSLGNRTFIKDEEGKISSGNICWQPRKYSDYTLWVCDVGTSFEEEKFWPLGLWLGVYRSRFLLKILALGNQKKFRHLWELERYLHVKDNLKSLAMDGNSKVGVINLQFGGTEMEKKPNWEQLLNSPNNPIY